ncbi:hypothetical protein ACOMHN_048033 [Nucella lapillus]
MLPSDCHVGWTRCASATNSDTSDFSGADAERTLMADQSHGTAPELSSGEEMQRDYRVKCCCGSCENSGIIDSECKNPDHLSECGEFGAESLCVCFAHLDTSVTAVDDLNIDDIDVEQLCAMIKCDVPEGVSECDTFYKRNSGRCGCTASGTVDECLQKNNSRVTEQCCELSPGHSEVCACRPMSMREDGFLSHTVVKEDISVNQCCSYSSKSDQNKNFADDNTLSKIDSAYSVLEQMQSPRKMNCNSNADTDYMSSDNENVRRSASGTGGLNQANHIAPAPQSSGNTHSDPSEHVPSSGEEASGNNEVVGQAQSQNPGHLEDYPSGGMVSPLASDLASPHSVLSLDLASSMECVGITSLLSAISVEDPDCAELSDSSCQNRHTGSLPLVSAIQGRAEPCSEASSLNPAMTVDLNEVPDEVLLQVFSYLKPDELCRHVTGVCKCWRRLAYDHSLWKTLDVSGVRINGFQLCQVVLRTSGAIRILDMAGLERLNCAEMAVVAENCPQLTQLDVGFVDDFNCTMVHSVLTSCPLLEFLNLEGCRHANNEVMRVLAASAGPLLRRLNFSHCTLVDESLWLMMQHLPGLTHLNIDGISWISELVVQHLATEYRGSLELWELDGNELTDSTIDAVSTCGQLKTLSISFCELLTDRSLTHLTRLQKLEKLCLRKGPSMTTAALQEFLCSPMLQNLTYLDLTECQQLEDTGVQAIAETCGQKLKTLYLSWCWDVTDTGMEHVANRCSKMVNMYLVGLHRLVAMWLSTAVETMTALAFISFEQCNEVVDVVIEEAVRDKPDLVIVNYYGELFMHNTIPD